jgi:hypothetical protein
MQSIFRVAARRRKIPGEPRKLSAGPVGEKWIGLNRSTMAALCALNG